VRSTQQPGDALRCVAACSDCASAEELSANLVSGQKCHAASLRIASSLGMKRTLLAGSAGLLWLRSRHRRRMKAAGA
jgi:hypothetical protein